MPTTEPSSARICFHAMVRRMKLVKNGAMTQHQHQVAATCPALNAIA